MRQSIERQSGLPIALDPHGYAIRWPESVSVGTVSGRSAAEMRAYIREAGALAGADPVYTVYRRISRSADSAAIAASGLRFDITVIPPGHFAGGRREFLRTAGHYHVPVEGRLLPEAYQVISGRAYWLIQRPTPGDPGSLGEIYAIEGSPGDCALMPPGFGHVSINAFSEPLVLANCVAEAVRYDYEPYLRFRGGGYRVLEGHGGGAIEFELNPDYRTVPELRKIRPRELPELGLGRSRPLYSLIREPGALRFLIAPDEFPGALTIDACYRPA